MTLDQLRVFVAVAEAEHMTKAAAALHLTQPAVSAAIAALEARYGTPLFDRVGRRIELTATGRMFLPEARAVLKRAAEAELALGETVGLKRGRLAIHASQTIANYWLPERLVRFRARYPEIELAITIGNTAQVALSLREGRGDLGLIEGQIDDPALAQTRIEGDALVVVVGATHPWARGRGRAVALEPRRLTETPWVLREPGSGTRSEFAAALRRLGLDLERLDIALSLPSNEAVRAAVEAGAGASAISHLVVAASLRAGTLCRIPLDLPTRPFYLVRHKARYRSRAARAFAELIDPEPAR
ncbi:MAG TPA: LysR substrate-binding domain-containing protein [Alphaproteobacteria bacterium]|nr:LysR substrate-binding domain-containing protein [Alphaproteobacteria bacterium]